MSTWDNVINAYPRQYSKYISNNRMHTLDNIISTEGNVINAYGLYTSIAWSTLVNKVTVFKNPWIVLIRKCFYKLTFEYEWEGE